MRGVERVEFGAVDGVRQHRRQEGAAGIAGGPRRVVQQPVEQRPVGRRQAVPDFLDRIDGLVADVRRRLLGELRRDADSQGPRQQLQQRPATRRIERVQPALQDRRRLEPGGALQGLDHLAQGRRRPGGGIGLPDESQRLREVADIVVGQGEKLVADLLLAEAAQQRGLGGGKVEAAGQGRQRPAAVRIGGGAQIGLDQPQLGVTRRFERQGIQKPGKGLHGSGAFFLAAGEMQRLGLDVTVIDCRWGDGADEERCVSRCCGVESGAGCSLYLVPPCCARSVLMCGRLLVPACPVQAGRGAAGGHGEEDQGRVRGPQRDHHRRDQRHSRGGWVGG